MQTFVLNPVSRNLPISGLVEQIGSRGVEVRDDAGKVVAYVLPPDMKEALTYMEARQALEADAEEIRAAATRRGGRTTREILDHVQRLSQSEPGEATQ